MTVQQCKERMLINTTSAGKVLGNLISWIRETKDMARDNLDHKYGTQGDRHVELILSQVLDKYDELQQQQAEREPSFYENERERTHP